MIGYIIDPVLRSFEKTILPDGDTPFEEKIVELLNSGKFKTTFIYPQEHTTCTAYMTTPKAHAPFFRVKGFADKVKFGITIVIDQTATGVPESDGITLENLKPLITFFT